MKQVVLLAGFALLGMIGWAWEFSEDFEGVVPPAILPADWGPPPVGWGLPGLDLWKTVESDKLDQEPAAASFSRALYYGEAAADGTGSYAEAAADGGAVITPDLTDPGIGLAPGDWVQVSFRYYREVEQGAPGYDETIACLVFLNASDKFWDPKADDWGEDFACVEIFHEDSGDPLEQGWQEFVSDPVQVPEDTDEAYLLFRFWPKDGLYNDYLGWLVDDVVVRDVPAIVLPALPGGTVGDPYTAVVDADGGNPPYTWSVDPSYPLPEGLSLRQTDWDHDEDDEAVIEGTPAKAGTFWVKILLEDSAGVKAERLYTLTINQPGAITEDFNAGLPADWTATGLWNNTNMVIYDGNNIATTACMYFGIPGQYNYDTGTPIKGELSTPQFDVTAYRNKAIKLTFDYWRQVENYSAGAFDKTWIECVFDTGDTYKIWYKDSTSLSQCTWVTETVDRTIEGNPILVPADAKWMQIVFHFDSVDALNNNYVGWLIDNFSLQFLPVELQITNAGDLPAGEVNVPYCYKFEVFGGVPPYRWEASRGLPPGLELYTNTKNAKECELRGRPEEAGDYTFTITVTDSAGNSTSEECHLTINRQTSLLFEDFNSGLGQWTATGLWHATDSVKGVSDLQGKAAYYGQDDTGAPNYAVGSRTKGELTSPEIDVAGYSAFKIDFRYWREVEFYDGGGYDQTYVQVRFKTNSGWTGWYTIWSKDCSEASAKGWLNAEAGPYNIPSGATQMQIRFVFDSVDQFYNNFVGWLVDNVKVSIATNGDPLPTMSIKSTPPRQRIAFFNYPNPITDVHTTVFGVRGVEADLIRVEIYDLAGRLVWEGEALGNELTWHTEDLAGRYLANGVYLYVIYVKVGDSWIHSGIRKLAIYR